MRIKSAREITPVPSRCISVDSPDRLFAAGGDDGHSVITHNSVVQRNIVLGCILRPEHWRFLGIDLKRVELSDFRAYSNVVLGVATTLEDALTVLRFAQQTMMKRYSEMEQLGIKNFLDLPEKGQALMVMVDEMGELLSPEGVKTEEGKANDEMKGEAAMILGSIARLGRAAGVHLVVATQRPDATILKGETKANLGVRINCGRTDTNASLMILGNGEGLRVRANPRGRLYLSIYGVGNHGQGLFADPSWIDEYLARKGLNPDGTPISKKRSKLATVVDMSQFEEGDLDSREGVDNSSVIEQIRQEESNNMDDDELDLEEFGLNDDVTAEASEDKLGRPELGLGEKKDFSRPEDSWDMELEDLIAENND